MLQILENVIRAPFAQEVNVLKARAHGQLHVFVSMGLLPCQVGRLDQSGPSDEMPLRAAWAMDLWTQTHNTNTNRHHTHRHTHRRTPRNTDKHTTAITKT